MMDGKLGCGTYEAYAFTRGGKTLVAQIPWSALTFSRVLDDTSPGHVESEGFTAEQKAQLGMLRPWRHEIAFFRDGLQVWIGPQQKPQSAPVAKWQADAADLSAWWDHRFIHNDHIYAGIDLATIFQDVATDAMAPDNSPGLFVETTPSGVLGTMSLLASQNLTAGPQLRNLANIGIDWTVIRREVLAGGVVVPVASIGSFTDEHFSVQPTVILDGTLQANSWTVRGSGGGAAGDDIYATAIDEAAADADGLLESVSTDSTIQDFASALAAATSKTLLTSLVVSVEQGQLSQEAPFTFDQLVPGALCDLALANTTIPVFGRFRLAKVDVTAQAPDGEQVVVAFQPVGTEGP